MSAPTPSVQCQLKSFIMHSGESPGQNFLPTQLSSLEIFLTMGFNIHFMEAGLL